jgi:hypothetical protein
VFTVTDPSGRCSCDLYRSTPPKRFDEEQERAQYKKKGWSDAKIARAIAGRRPNPTRHDRFVERVAQLAVACGKVQLCTIDGQGDVPTLPRTTIALGDYLSAAGTYPHTTMVSVHAG